MRNLLIGRLLRNKIIQNTGYLSIIEIFRLLLPFVALPYIIRTVGVTNYGSIAFVQAIISYFQIYINWGLDVSAVKDVSISRDNKKALNRIVTSVLSIKFIHLLISALILCISAQFIPYVRDNSLLFLFCFLTCFTEVLFPIWFYQGIEKMQYLALIRFASILFYAISVFIFIKKADDFLYVPLLQSIGNILGGVVSLYILLHVERISFTRLTRRYVVQMYKDSASFFLSRVSVVLNNSIAKTISGIFFSMHVVAAFDLAQKITNFSLVPISMMNQALYPNIAKSQDRNFVQKCFRINILLSALISVSVFILAPYAINFFAKNDLELAVVLTRILCVWVFFGGIVVYLGSPTLIAFGYPKPFNNSILLGTATLLSSYLLMFITGNVEIVYFACALCLAESVMLFYRLYYNVHYKILYL